ncbi:MAG: shikimate dehydrogenase [Clostridia bacterium]|nr:shikimate dehydrogenase [Clostridia bacterium]
MQKIKLDIIGDPVSHSKSPIIHSTVLTELGLDFEYRKVRVKKGELENYLDEAKTMGVNGFSLTMPHKKDIIGFLDYIDEDALAFDAVNTVKIEDGKLFGYNTDGQGFALAVKNRGFDFSGKNIVILGAGGAASTVALKSEMEGAKKITILNRTLSSAEAIAKKLVKCQAEAGIFDADTISKVVVNCDLLINATPLGMTGVDSDFEDFSFFDYLKNDAWVFDLIYNPEETNFLKEAKSHGFNTLNGFDMLIYQGLWADKIFLELSLDFPYLKGKIKESLKNF